MVKCNGEHQMRSINEVLVPQKFKSDFQVKRDKQLAAAKDRSLTYDEKLRLATKRRRFENPSLQKNGVRRPFIDYNAPAPSSDYQPPK